MFKLKASLLAMGLVAATTSYALANPFEGIDKKDLFPAATTDVELNTAYDALIASNLPDARERFAGKTITVGVLGGGARGGISGPFYFWRTAFEQVTGAKLEIIELPFTDLLTSTLTDFATGQNTYDIVVPAAWFYGDYIQGDYIIPLNKYFDDPAYPAWNREAVAPGIKNLMTWGDQWYGTIYDGDTQLLYYRKDILSDPEWQAAFKAETGKDMPTEPTTWQELYEITNFFNGKDWNKDGDPDDGISLHLKGGGFGYFHFMSLSSSFAIEPSPGDDPTKVDQNHNVYWFDPVDMKPLINEPGHVAALEYLIQLSGTGSQSQLSWDLAEAWKNFLTGNAIATFSWGDVGSLAQDPNASTIRGKLGAVRIPCSDTWYSRAEGKMKTDKANPNCVGNVVGGSWHGVISKASDEQDLSYYLLAMLSAPEINFWTMANGWTGVDPGSTLHLFEPEGTAKVEDFVATGFDAGDAEEFIGAYGDNMFSFPTYQSFLRIPGTPAYWEIMDTRLNEAMTNQKTPQEAMDALVKEWNTITDDLDRDDQLELYRAAIGFNE